MPTHEDNYLMGRTLLLTTTVVQLGITVPLPQLMPPATGPAICKSPVMVVAGLEWRPRRCDYKAIGGAAETPLLVLVSGLPSLGWLGGRCFRQTR